jgi:non-ribosomal peptide synthetase-like protein
VLSRASPPEGAPGELTAPPKLLHQFFERQAAAAPHATAIACGALNITYGELESLSEDIAQRLVAHGVKRGSCVALLLPRGPQVYGALLGVLKAGAAYVPLDPDYPPERVKFILEDCAARVLVTCKDLSPKSEGFEGKTLILDAPDASAESVARPQLPAPGAHPEDLCYIIYTSGTTGRPKGVQIEHRSACHLVQAERRIFQICATDRVFQGFSIAFDASVEEIWLAFATGATLVVGTADILHSGPALSHVLTEAGVTVLSCVPTLLAMMEADVPSLRLLILGGEVCPPELVKRWWKPGRRIVNTYGPTEATVVATCADCHPANPITIGRPLPGYIALVVNDQAKFCQPGEPGELWLGGIGLARGYLGKPELTDEKFIYRDFDGSRQRFYRTGDRVRWTENHELEFLGRIDSQVKIRGFRVELSEIESVLLECPEVKAAAAALHEDASHAARLVAYVVPRSSTSIEPASLRARLRAHLPAYMVPVAIDVLPALPTLSSGKIDRQALPIPSTARIDLPREVVHPRTSLESRLVEAWSSLFSVPDVNITDDFFLDLGGHSLLAARMVSELRRLPEFEALSMADVYRYPTPAGLAQELESRSQLNVSNKAWRHRGEEVSGSADAASSAPRKKQQGLPKAAISETHPIPFWRHFFCGAAQLLSLVFVLSFFALQWLAPYLTFTMLIEEEYDFVTSLLLAFASLVLVYPVMLLVAILLKWLIIGRYKSGTYPLWGWYYLRFWFVTAVEATVPVSYLSGTPLLGVYLRLMGAKVGRNVFIQTDDFAIYDLLSIGDNSSINADASLLGYSVADGLLTIGSIAIGNRCFVGTRAAIGENASMAHGSSLENLSLLPAGMAISAGETWVGSPAQPGQGGGAFDSDAERTRPEPHTPAACLAFGALHAAGLLIFPILVVAALFPGIALMNQLNYLDPYYWYLFLSPLVALSFVAFVCLEIVGLKWLLLGRIRPGSHRLDSWYYVRKWFVDKTMELSLDVVGPLYASVYLSPWYKMLGAKLGHGAEISTASFISPDLLSIGAESFIADNASLGAPRVRDGVISLGPNQIGRRAFIGNSAMVPPGTIVGDEVLIGCLSTTPQHAADALRPDSAWIGSPGMSLWQRLKTPGFSQEMTFDPSARLRALRAAIEFVRVIAPSSGFIILTSLMFSALLLLHDSFNLVQTLLFFPLLYVACGVAAALFTILVKWLLVGRYRPAEKPLWSTFVWRNELINALHEHLAGPFLINALTGTPFLCWYLRLLGARIGRRVFLETTDFSEFDLARIGDEAALNADCTVQTHLFEDRVMKMSHLDIGPRCSVGTSSLVLYDTRMEPGSRLGPLSLLMKGEVLPAGTAWAGSPARSEWRGRRVAKAD